MVNFYHKVIFGYFKEFPVNSKFFISLKKISSHFLYHKASHNTQKTQNYDKIEKPGIQPIFSVKHGVMSVFIFSFVSYNPIYVQSFKGDSSSILTLIQQSKPPFFYTLPG